jgi:hypothetical protein
VTAKYNARATPKAYLSALDDLVEESWKADGCTFVLQNSSHGTQVEDSDGDEVDGYDEALYLWGLRGSPTVTDDQVAAKLANMNENCRLILICDSCFSGTMHRRLAKCRFVKPPFRRSRKLPVRPLFRSVRSMPNVAILAACAEGETAADANYSGRYNGAFTYCALMILEANPKITFKAFRKELGKLLPSRDYEQSPQVICPEAFEEKEVFG